MSRPLYQSLVSHRPRPSAWPAWLRSPAVSALLQGTALLLVGVVALLHAADHIPSSLGDRVTDIVTHGETGGDFVTYYAAGQLYSRQHDASSYDLDTLREMELTVSPSLRHDAGWLELGGVKSYPNPPYYLPFLSLFAPYSLPVAFALSTALQALLLGLLLALTAGLATGRAAARVIPVAAFAWIVITLAFDDLWDGFVESQVPASIAGLAFAAGIVLLRRGRPGWAGLVWTLLSAKPQYVPAVVLYLLVQRQWRALAGFVTGGIALTILSTWLVGIDGMLLYAQTTIQSATAPPDMYFANYEWMFNWRALLQRALTGSAANFVVPGQIVLILLTVAIACWAWMAPSARRGWRRDVSLVVLALTMTLANPHVHAQDLVLLVPAAALLVRWGWSRSLPWPIPVATSAGLLGFYWLLPQQLLFSPSVNNSVLLLAAIFAVSVVILRRDFRITLPRPSPRTFPTRLGAQPAPSRR